MAASLKRWLRRVVVIAVLAAAVTALRATVLKPKPVPVTVYVVARGRVEATVTNSKAGTIETRRRATLSPELGGRVAALPVTEGDRVRAGDVLLRLGDDELQAQVLLQGRSLEAARALRRQACLAADLAGRELARNQALREKDVVSEELLDQLSSRRDETRSACHAAGAREREAAAALEVAEVQLAKTVMVAPFDGVVAEVDTEVGEWITPSPSGLMLPAVIELLDPDAIYLSAPIDEVDLARVRTGLDVRVTLDAFAGEEYAGTVSRVAPYVVDLEGQNRTVDVEVELADRAFARSLLPGTSADVEVILERRSDVLRVPTYALMEGGRVLVVDGQTLVERAVTTGLRNWQFAEVTSGLQAGDRVVVSLDRVEVEAGATVTVVGSSGA